MVTLSLLKLLEDRGFGTIDKDLFWEKMGLGKEGLYISSVGGSNSHGARPTATYQIYSRGSSDVEGYQKLQAVADFLTRSFDICTLPAVPPVSNFGYGGVTILPPSSISAVGADLSGRMIYSITGQVYYRDKLPYVPPPEPTDDKVIETEGGTTLLSENSQYILTEEKQ